jgi:hypothetical protein
MPKDFEFFLSNVFFNPDVLESKKISMAYMESHDAILSLNFFDIVVMMGSFGLDFYNFLQLDKKKAVMTYKDYHGRSFVVRYRIDRVNLVPSDDADPGSHNVSALSMYIEPKVLVFEHTGQPEEIDMKIFVEKYMRNKLNEVGATIVENARLEKSLGKNKDSYVV